ncbi:response regulator [Bradyrhizobium sp. DOA1]|uniref:response regulator n=1 Tax=Bradyrhizobium sp. DOA1 TaxID=1126616 RepID=UPI00077C3B36|nr:response regulator [Bradyrhizobium sp. DOA1]
MLARTLGETIRIEKILASDLWETQADITELESAVLNLALNARDAMPNGGALTLETANAFLDENFLVTADRVNSTQYVSVSVSDTGAGMSLEVADKAFEPFFTTKPPGMGTGLGLSQVYGFVKQSDGDVKIKSKQGAGTTVTIYLPRHMDVGKPTAKDNVIESAAHGRGQRVLVTEDDEGVRKFVSETLIELGYEVMQAKDGDAALSALATHQVDLLLTDVVMPGMNGRALTEEAQRRRPGLKVLYMTGYSRDAIVHQGRLDRGVSLIQKPFTQSDLARRVQGVLEGS